MGSDQLQRIKQLLDENGIAYRVSEHEPVYTSEQAAQVRRVELKTGVKALVLKVEGGHLIMGLVAADRRVDLARLAEIVHANRVRLASPREVLERTECEVGSVHPFGNLHQLPTYLDCSVLENDTVNFNAGLHTTTIQMKATDLLKAVQPIVAQFSRAG